jgi:hypothetical protein
MARRTFSFIENRIEDVKHAFSTMFSGFAPGRALSIPLPNISKIASHFAGLGGKILDKIGKVDISGIITGAAKALGKLVSTFVGAGSKIFGHINPVDVSGIIKGATSALSGLVNTFIGAGRKIFDHISPVDVSGIIKGAASALSGLLNTFAGAAFKIWSMIFPVDVSNIITGASAAVEGLVGMFAGLASRIVSAIGTIVPHISMPDIPGVPGLARGYWGGETTGPMLRWIGEAGREAVVPLDRPLSEVDPSVRWLSAIAQGKVLGSSGGASKTVDAAGWQIITPTDDPHAVAAEVINHMAAAGF